MTTIGNSKAMNAELPQDTRSSRGGGDKEQNPFSRQERNASKFGTGSDMKRQGGAATQQTREAEFAGKLQQALIGSGSSGGDGGGEPGSNGEGHADPRLLAMVEPPSLSSLLAGDGVGSKTEQTSLHARTTELMARIATGAETSLRTAMQGQTGGVINLRLQLDGRADGLAGVTISSTATSLDVVLERLTGTTSEELLQAAQALALSLQKRFPKRIVRVLDKVSGENVEATSFDKGSKMLAGHQYDIGKNPC